MSTLTIQQAMPSGSQMKKETTRKMKKVELQTEIAILSRVRRNFSRKKEMTRIRDMKPIWKSMGMVSGYIYIYTNINYFIKSKLIN